MPLDSACDWLEHRSFHHSRPGEVAPAARERPVSVCLPARERATTIGPIVARLAATSGRGAVDGAAGR